MPYCNKCYKCKTSVLPDTNFCCGECFDSVKRKDGKILSNKFQQRARRTGRDGGGFVYPQNALKMAMRFKQENQIKEADGKRKKKKCNKCRHKKSH